MYPPIVNSTDRAVNYVYRPQDHKHYGADYLNEIYVNRCLGLSCGLDVVFDKQRLNDV